jgi:predicted MFS family arabinose efflux permease
MVLPSLFIAQMTSDIPSFIASLLLIEIGQTFGSPIGVTGQITTASSMLRIVTALIMSVLSISYSYKLLLIVGLILGVISAFGSGLAVNFGMLIVFFTLTGPVYAMIKPMTSTLIAQNFPPERRTTALGWRHVASIVVYIIGPPIIKMVAGTGGWRFAFLAYMLPVALVSVIMGKLWIPSHKPASTQRARNVSIDAFRSVLLYRSSLSCLIAHMLRLAMGGLMITYAISFLRQQHSISRDTVSILFTVGAIITMVGSVGSGRLVNRFGRKNVTSLALGVSSILAFLFSVSSQSWLAVSIWLITFLTMGIDMTTATSLMLEQVPEYRGTMMSLMITFSGVGSTIGTGLGGVLLLLSGWSALGITFGAMGIIGALLQYRYAVDLPRK